MTNFLVIFLTFVSPLSLSDGWNVFLNDDAVGYRNKTLEALKTNLPAVQQQRGGLLNPPSIENL